jgi:hypothetical protein
MSETLQPTELKTSPCRGCGKPMVWGETPDGKKIPLDPKPPVYHRDGQKPDGTLIVLRLPDAYVSHFATCAKANDFSASKKRTPVGGVA